MTRKQELLHELMVMETADPTKKISDPEQAVSAFMKYANKKQEHFVVMSLNSGHEVIRTRVITKGIVDRTLVHPREVFAPTLKENGSAVIVAHNHPSGNVTPSQEDRDLTTRLLQSGEILGISVLDHIIVSKNGYYSFLEHGCLY